MTATAFNEMVINNSEFLQPAAYNLTKSGEDAKDLVQETLYKAIANYEKYNAGTNIKAWLFTIMRNIFINNYRKNKKFTKVSSDTPQEIYMFQQNSIAHNSGETSIKLNEILEAIAKLPEIYRISFEMHYNGYKYHEIAEVLDEPLGTIKSRIHFARKILSSKITRH